MALIFQPPEPCPDFNRFTPAYFEAKEHLENFDVEVSLSRVKSQAENGCKTCLVIYEGFLFCGGYGRMNAFNRDFESMTVRAKVLATGSTHIHINSVIIFRGLRRILTLSEFNICSVEGAYHPWQYLTKIQPSPFSVITDGKRTVFRKWIMECREKHTHSASTTPKHSPRRLLDTGPLPQDASGRDLEGKGMLVKEYLGACPPYITLSHCWEKSGADGVKTTRANLHERTRCLSWEDLPKTFQDAVVVTRWLGIRHLWIDCLCIIQASEDEDIETGNERSEEISRMGDIYAGSFVTIASHFDSEEPGGVSNDGLFLSKRCIREIVMKDNDGKEFKTYVKEEGSHGLNQPRTLTGRAWCLQERLLSPRILHFRKWEVIFECFSNRCCECTPNDTTAAYPPILASSLALYKEIRADTNLKCDVAEKLLYWKEVDGESSDGKIEHWHYLVEEYTQTTLTRSEDTLSALSGIVNSIPTGILGSYIAGLWSKNLPWDLLWGPIDPEKSERHPVYVAPSFSWASMRSPVRYKIFCNNFEGHIAEVLRSTIHPISEKDPLGALEFGSIRLRARMVQAQFRRSDSISTYLEIQSPLSLFHPYIVIAQADTYQDLERCTGCNVRLVDIATANPDQRRTETCLTTDGILITESITHPDSFERIGFFSLHSSLNREHRINSYCCFDGVQATEFTMV